MEKSDKKRNTILIVTEIFIIILGIVGITVATDRLLGASSTTILTVGNYEVEFKGEISVVGNNLEPISDSLITVDRTESVLRAEFSFKSGESNGDENLIYDIMLKDMNIDCSLLNKYTKWNLYKNGTLLSTGNFSPLFDGNVLGDNLILTNIQENLPKSDEGYDNYVLIVWISESCDDLATCEYIDQSGIASSNISFTAFIAVYNEGKQELIRVPSNDLSCANRPLLANGMIPVYYEDGSWKVADKNSNNWYNYSEQKWANSVIVSDTKYLNAEVGTVILNKDVVASLVWVPRFKYKTWNVNNSNNNSYDAYNKGIDIVFEGGLSSSGKVISADNGFVGSNGDYLTHPSFKNDLKGFWVSKYEMSLLDEKTSFVGNVDVLINEDVSVYEEKIKSFNVSNNVNGKIIDNSQWGAITYLSHSKYGLCPNNVCKKIGNNETNVSGINKQDTTTRNVYGVYDMSGSSSEYVIGNSVIGSATDEILLNENTTWYNLPYTNLGKDYLLRGGANEGLFFVGDFGMFNVGTRITITK